MHSAMFVSSVKDLACASSSSLFGQSLPVAQPARGRSMLRTYQKLPIQAIASSSLPQYRSGNGSQDPRRDSVELLIASYDDVATLTQGYNTSNGGRPAARYPERRTVSPPRSSRNVRQLPEQQRISTAKAEVAAKEMFNYQQNSSKALRAELNVATTDLRAKQIEFDKVKAVVRTKDKEIAELKVALVERDMKLKASKEDLLESRMLLQEKDAMLQTAYEALTTACKERSDLRRQLIEVQAELNETREELRKWTKDLAQLKSVMDSLDMDDELEASLVAAAEAASQAAGNGQDGMLNMLKELTDFSRQVLNEAKQDETVYSRAIGHMNTGSNSGRSFF